MMSSAMQAGVRSYYGYENSLGVHIRHLREKLETEPGAPRFLRMVRGIGYKLTKEGKP